MLQSLELLQSERALVTKDALALAAVDSRHITTPRNTRTLKTLDTIVSEGLKKYAKYKHAMVRGRNNQDDVLANLKVRTLVPILVL